MASATINLTCNTRQYININFKKVPEISNLKVEISQDAFMNLTNNLDLLTSLEIRFVARDKLVGNVDKLFTNRFKSLSSKPGINNDTYKQSYP